jgi:hypothetical protein
VLARNPSPAAAALSREVARCLADTHAFTELRLLSSVPATRLGAADRAHVTRALGGEGIDACRRLGLPPGSSGAECRAVALRAVRYWRAQLDSPLLDPLTAATCRAAARSCEAILTQDRAGSAVGGHARETFDHLAAPDRYTERDARRADRIRV